MDDLDNIASYFRIGLGELLGAPTPGDLSGDEGRLLLAFRVLAPATQDHVLRILEQLSLAPRHVPNRSLQLPATLNENARTEASHGRSLHAPADARRLINEAMVLLGQAAAVAGPDRPLSSARPEESPPGSVAR